MKGDGVLQGSEAGAKLKVDNGFEGSRTVDVDPVLSSKEMKTGEQTDESEEMIPMQMSDEDMADLQQAEVVAAYLNLSPLGAVEQEELLSHT